MKILHKSQNGVEVLSCLEGISVAEGKILKAGITQFFKKGKNKIIWEIKNAPTLDPQVIREVASLDILAKELSGKIVVLTNLPTIKQQILSFSNPPVFQVFDNLDLAIKSFTLPDGGVKKPSPLPGQPTQPQKPLSAQPAQKPLAATPGAAVTAPRPGTMAAAQAAAAQAHANGPAIDPSSLPPVVLTKEQVKEIESGMVGQLRKEKAQLEQELELLKRQLIELLISRKEPWNDASAKAEIEALKSKLTEMVPKTTKTK